MKIKFLTLGLCFVSLGVMAQQTETSINADVTKARAKISRNIYGHFSEHLGHCIYEGIWVGENSKIPNTNGYRNDVVEAFKAISVPVLRWPGGCFADEYHWKDGIGPRAQRPSMINTNWGGVTEDNSFGTHEFLNFCKLIGCEPYISGNLGSGTVQEMSQWVEYMNSNNVSPMTNLRKANGQQDPWGVKFFGVGNESWGCGGNMTAEYYSDIAKQFSTFCRDYNGNNLNRIASGPNGDDYHWTETVMQKMGSSIWGLSLHYYTWGDGETATEITDKNWFSTMKKTLYMEELVTKHSAIMDKYDPGKNVSLVVDEWGTWFKVEPGTNPGFLYQQNTIRDAMVAGTNLNIFNNHCDRVKMANIAQIVNVLQSIILTNGEKMVLTPTYYVFKMYKVHQDAIMVPLQFKSPLYTYEGKSIDAVNASASIDKDGKLHITVCNLDPKNAQKVNFNLNGLKIATSRGEIITSKSMLAYNSFDKPNEVIIKAFNGFKAKDNAVSVELPPMSVIMIECTGTMDKKKELKVENAKPGLNYAYYEGEWNWLPDFAKLQPKTTGVIDEIKYPQNIAEDNFGLTYDGYIKIEKDGVYDFSLATDDGSRLEIDDEPVVVHDGLHGASMRTGSVMLTKGYHKFKVLYFERGSGNSIDVYYQGKDIPFAHIPKEVLFH
jgi:alpha-N-arabinofuranosidase